MADLVGRQLGNYRLIRFLGRGDVAEVYLGEHIPSNNQVAIKVLGIHGGDETAFQNAAHALTQLNHPHILRIVDYGINYPYAFLVMDYLSNGNLRQRHPKGETVPLATIVSYVMQVTQALQYAHSKELFHSNIKPENMLIGSQNAILLGDIGFATTIETTLDDHVVGLNHYAYRVAGDQYSLGVVVYEWLCGDVPFHGASPWDILAQHRSTSPPSLREKVPTIPPAVEEVVMKALAKDPKDRFVSVQAFADALEHAHLASIRPKVSDRAGQQFGNYRLIRLLGHGGFADVYLGQHRRLNTYAAIKVLHTRLSYEDMESFQIKENSPVCASYSSVDWLR